jgi:outer membrane protein OmpA-like peptidoglycan-associated protein
VKYFLILCCVIPAFAEFNRTTGLIDIPKAEVLPHLGFRIGYDGSLALGSGSNNPGLEENLHFSVGFFNRFEAYCDVYTFSNFTAAIGFSHKFLETENISLAWGVHQISYSLDVSEVGHGEAAGWFDDLSYDRDDYEKPFELGSAFIVATYALNKSLEITAGFGRGRYCGYGTHSQYFNSNFYHQEGGDWGIGLLAGVEWQILDNLSFILEGDSRDINTGFTYQYQAVEIGLALTKWEYLFLSGESEFNPRLSASISYVQPWKSTSGIIAGTVFDAHGNAISAEVGFVDESILAVQTNLEVGTFTFSDLRSGTYEIYAMARGYRGSVRTVKVSQGETAYCEFELERESHKTGDIFGNVYDITTGEPLVAARVSLAEIDRSTTANYLGMFQFQELDPDVYRIRAEVDSYEVYAAPVDVNAGETTEVEIKMVKRGMRITIEGIEFDFGKATIKPESYGVLEEAANILRNNPDIRVEIQGHTDSVGSDNYNLRLSHDRARAVLEYLTHNHAIDASRFIARGYGEQYPIASNATLEGRAQNRRVEFFVRE